MGHVKNTKKLCKQEQPIFFNKLRIAVFPINGLQMINALTLGAIPPWCANHEHPCTAIGGLSLMTCQKKNVMN